MQIWTEKVERKFMMPMSDYSQENIHESGNLYKYEYIGKRVG